MAITLKEPAALSLFNVLMSADEVLISAVTAAEALVVARRRRVGPGMTGLLRNSGMKVVPVTADFAEQVANAYDRWGKGVHPAGLTFADCFAYALAFENACPLLYVGDDFAKTDILSALKA
jgi:ribonuclease VapC